MRETPRTLMSEFSADELTALTDLLKSRAMTGAHLEIGTAAGGTLAKMMSCYETSKRPHFVVIDTMTYFARQYEIVRENLRREGINPDDVEFRISRSHNAFRQAEIACEKYEFILIDGAHKCRYVMQDLCWTRLLQPGGILCLHDYHANTPGVVAAADRFLGKYRNYSTLALVGKLLTVQKRETSSTAEVDLGDHCYATVLTPLLQFRRSVGKRISWMRR